VVLVIVVVVVVVAVCIINNTHMCFLLLVVVSTWAHEKTCVLMFFHCFPSVFCFCCCLLARHSKLWNYKIEKAAQQFALPDKMAIAIQGRLRQGKKHGLCMFWLYTEVVYDTQHKSIGDPSPWIRTSDCGEKMKYDDVYMDPCST